MALNIPACGIEAYMEGEVLRWAPGNTWWKISRWLATSSWPGPVLVFILGGLTALFWKSDLSILAVSNLPKIFAAFLSAAFIIGLLFAAAALLAASWSVYPGRWTRYSLGSFKNEYDYVMPELTRLISGIRARLPEAEFEVEVFNLPEDDFQFVVFQVCDTLDGVVHPYGAKGKALAVFDGKGLPQQFGEGYIPFGSFGKVFGSPAEA